jgi:farnesol dehydrogenase
MKIFLTGANGFLGSSLARHLSSVTARELVLLVRPGRDFNAPRADNIRLVEGDLTDPESYSRHLDGCDTVVHAAALVATWARDSSVFDRINVQATLDLIENSRNRGVGKLVYLSSFMALAPSPDGSPLDESAPFERKTHYNDYERTKYLANMEIARLVKQGAPVVVIYPTVIYGPGPLTAGNLIVDMVLDHMRGRLPARLGDGSQTWNFVFVEDVVAGVVKAVEKASPGERYILGGENVTLKRFFEILEQATGKAPPRLALPWPVARLTGALEELLAVLFGRMPITTRGAVDIFRLNWAFDSSHAAESLSYGPRTLAEGMAQTVDWIRSEGLDR